MTSRPDETIIHGSCVAVGSSAVLVLGASGSGKSGLVLQLMALGGELVADDRVLLKRVGDGLQASCPKTIEGRIEARGVGILAANHTQSAVLRLAVDLDRCETQRLPPFREIELLGRRIDLLHGSELAHFPAAVLQYLKGGRCA